jgi:hypothetical protein
MYFKTLSAIALLVFNSSISRYSNKMSVETQIFTFPEIIASNIHLNRDLLLIIVKRTLVSITAFTSMMLVGPPN